MDLYFLVKLFVKLLVEQHLCIYIVEILQTKERGVFEILYDEHKHVSKI